MGYLKTMYGEQSKDFIKGVIAALDYYSIWKDGIQVIGCMNIPITEEIKKVKKELGWPD